jgi:hypothetical protein
MKVNIHISPDFSTMNNFMKSVPQIFDDEGETLKKDRNEIKVIWHGQLRLCIKSFNRVTTFNRLMYSWFRSTKAKRSYRVARRLEKIGINTPKPVGYIEVYGRWGILKKAFYVSIYYEHDFDLTAVLNTDNGDQERILSCFSQYMAHVVHPLGAWHNDLSSGNVLVNVKGEEDWSFSFIDLNRVKFKRYISPARGLINLKKLTNKPVFLALMAEQYALAANRREQLYAALLLRKNFLFSFRRFYRKKVLRKFKPHK